MSALAGTPARALLFDFGGTLDSDGVPWKERFLRIWREEMGEPAAGEFDAAFYAADDALVGTVPRSMTLSDTVALLARGVAARLPPPGEESARTDRVARVASRFTKETLCVLAARGALLGRLSAQFRLGIVSNFYGNLAAVCAEAGIAPHFSAAIDSTVVGDVKPGAGIFRAALSALDASPEETVLVGDSVARDMDGARAIGMRHVLLRPAAAPPAPPCCPEDRVIARLNDLEGVLA